MRFLESVDFVLGVVDLISPIRTFRHPWFDKGVTVKESMYRRWFDRTSCCNIRGTADFVSGGKDTVFGEEIFAALRDR